MNIKVCTQKELREAYTRGVRNGVRNTLSAVEAIVALHLLDKAGIPAEVVANALNAIDRECRACNEGYLDINDIIDTLKEEYGITIRRIGENEEAG